MKVLNSDRIRENSSEILSIPPSNIETSPVVTRSLTNLLSPFLLSNHSNILEEPLPCFLKISVLRTFRNIL